MIDYPLDSILLPQGAKEVKDEKKMDALWDDPDYIAEEKYDGSRYVSVGGRLFSRRVSDVTGFPVEKTGNVPHISHILSKYPLLILDGEVYFEGMSSNEVTTIMGASSDKARWRQGYGEFKEPLEEGKKNQWRWSIATNWVEVPKKEVEELLISGVKAPLKYVMFDILRDFDGTWLIDLPWSERRVKLVKTIFTILCDNGNEELVDNIQLSTIEARYKRDFYNSIMAKGGEGVILKNMKAKYVPDKKPMWNWVKVKKHITDDVVIMGFKPAKREYEPERPELINTHPYWEAINGDKWNLSGKEEAIEVGKEVGHPLAAVSKFYFYGWIGAVTFGKLDPNNVVTMCDRSGEDCKEYPQLKELGYFSGINEELRQDMTNNPEKYIGECVEIGAMEKTKDGFYRHPQFSRMRPDKNPSECVLEE